MISAHVFSAMTHKRATASHTLSRCAATTTLSRRALEFALSLLDGGARVARQFALLNRMRNTDIFFVGVLCFTTRLIKKILPKIFSTATFNGKVVLGTHDEQVVYTNHQG